jgi:hypothetical protein
MMDMEKKMRTLTNMVSIIARKRFKPICSADLSNDLTNISFIRENIKKERAQKIAVLAEIQSLARKATGINYIPEVSQHINSALSVVGNFIQRLTIVGNNMAN